jgi:long-chain acyl-CoA synthetase
LSYNNLQSNAESIRQYLGLTPAEKPIASLPMSYSYGLSVINSHLLAGGTLVLVEHGVLRREFWDCIDLYSCTSLAGVPYTYQMLLQTGLLQKRGASLRTLTQAGGALAPEYIRKMHELALQRGFRFFVMYGQTEATARIAFVPFEQLGEKIGAIGVAIPGGKLEVDAITGELLYTGSNVMMGYAESRDDLSRSDDLQGTLRTGDLARQDKDGFFYITGRLKRFLKLFGKRFNLDEVEQILQTRCGHPIACFGRDDQLMIAVESENDLASKVSTVACETFSLPSSAVRVRMMPRIPRTDRGKTDYPALQGLQSSADGGSVNDGLLVRSSPA